MSLSAHELVLDLEPAVTTDSGLRYHATVVARAAEDGHWNAWLEFVDSTSQNVRRTGIETHQATEAALRHWATTLGDVYLGGALDRALVSRSETMAHYEAIAQAAAGGLRGSANAVDPFELYAIGEHVLRRELLLFKRATLLALINNYDLNPRALDLSRFTKTQMITFIVTAVEVRQSRTGKRRRLPRPHTPRASKR